MAYRGDKICQDEWTNAADGQPEKHNAFANTVGWRRTRHKI